MTFLNRSDAGRKLAKALASYKNQDAVVLALPRGGVPVAAEIAAALGAPLDVILVRKIGAVGQPELAMGAVVDGAEPIVIRNDDVIKVMGITEPEFQAVCARELAEIERRRQLFLGQGKRPDIAGRVVIVVDDGVATGATARAALQATRKRGPSQLVFAVPVAAADSVESLESEVDAIVCLEAPRRFGAVGSFYDDFRQVGDDEVVALLKRFSAGAPPRAQLGSAN